MIDRQIVRMQPMAPDELVCRTGQLPGARNRTAQPRDRLIHVDVDLVLGRQRRDEIGAAGRDAGWHRRHRAEPCEAHRCILTRAPQLSANSYQLSAIGSFRLKAEATPSRTWRQAESQIPNPQSRAPTEARAQPRRSSPGRVASEGGCDSIRRLRRPRKRAASAVERVRFQPTRFFRRVLEKRFTSGVTDACTAGFLSF